MNTQTAPPATRFLANCFWISGMVLALFSGAAWLFRSHVNADIAWYLYASERVADGAVIYRDVSDMNPPLIYFLHLPFAWLGRLFHVPTHVPFYCGVLAILCGALVLSARLLARFPRLPRGWAYPVLLFAIVDFTVVSRFDFGQRDQIFACLLLPVVLLAAARVQDLPLRRTEVLVVAAMAAIGVALKPYFLVPFGLLFLALAFRLGFRKAIRLPEVLAVVLFNGAYALAVCIWFPRYLSIIRMGQRYYGVYNCPTADLLQTFLACGLVLAVCLWFTVSAPLRAVQWLNVAVCLGLMAEIAAQHKGWSYHFVPLLFFTKLGVVLALLDMAYVRMALIRWRTAAILLLLGMVPTVYAFCKALEPTPDRGVSHLRNAMLSNASGPMVLVLTTDVWLTFPALYETHQKLAFPAGVLWTTAGMYLDQIQAASTHDNLVPAHYHMYDQAGEDEKQFLDDLRRSIAGRPGLILVQGTEEDEHKSGFGRLRFDFLEYLSQDGTLRQALADYHVVSSGRVVGIPWRLLALGKPGA